MAESPTGVDHADLASAGRIDVRPDPTELAGALLGNGSLLVTLDDHGVPLQLWWPHPDRDASVADLSLLLELDGHDVDVRTLRALQCIEPDADVVRTRLELPGGGHVELDALVDPAVPRLLLRLRTHGASGALRPVLRFVPTLGGSQRANATFSGPDGDLVAYRGDRVLAVHAAVGPDGTGAAVRTRVEPPGPHSGGGPVTVRVEIEPGADQPGADRGDVLLVVGFAHDAASALSLAQEASRRGFDALADARRRHDAAVAATRTPTLVDGGLDVLDRCSLRVLRSLQDADGGVLAAPEVDPDAVRSGGYGYIWPRDLAAIVIAGAVAGDRDLVHRALDFLARAIASDGLYEQRYWSDATPAPSWGLQLDETGAVVHAVAEAARLLREPSLIVTMWPTIVAAADALAALLHPLTGLPPASLDPWEERVGVHTYTVAATVAGLDAAARMAVGRDEGRALAWRGAAARCRTGLFTHLWSEEHGRFLRGRDVARDDGAGAPVPTGHQPVGRAAHPVRSIDLVDATVDASLLGLAYPFAVLSHDDPRLVATIDAVERELTRGTGLLRYPGDRYLGGNPWLLTRIWLGLARRAPGASVAAEGLAEAQVAATGAGLLPEQVDVCTGRPVWVVPLAWTHALVALACRPDHRVPAA